MEKLNQLKQPAWPRSQLVVGRLKAVWVLDLGSRRDCSNVLSNKHVIETLQRSGKSEVAGGGGAEAARNWECLLEKRLHWGKYEHTALFLVALGT